MDPFIAIIDPATQRAETASFNQIALASPLRVTYHLPALAGMESLHQLRTQPKGVIILGSYASVLEELEWQQALSTWLKPRFDQGLPALGLCYGHQLLAHLYGGKIDYAVPDRTKLRGLRAIQLDADPLWGEPRTGEVVVSHCEVVTRCPSAFAVVGRSPQVPIEAIRHKALPLWGFQSHPEATVDFLKLHCARTPSPEEALKFGWALVESFLRYLVD